MKTTRSFIFRFSLLVFAILFLLTGSRTYAQSKSSARITASIDETKLVQMQTRVHPLARPEFDRGVVADSQRMNRMMLVLKRSPEQQAALAELMNEQQTKNSPNYHAWLTPAQFGQQFGVADADVQQVTGWLTQKGFTGIKVAPGKMFIEFSGTAGKVRSAFHTDMHQFMVHGEMHMANTSVPQIPAALSSVVASVHSLHNFRKKSFMHFSKALEQAKSDGKLKSDFGTGGGLYAVAPGDFATIYHLPPTSALTGSGQTIALVARSNIAVSDVTQFGTGFGISNLTSFTAANNILLESSDPGIVPGDDGEATLDVEWSGAVAPGAKILLVVADGTLTTTFNDGVDLSALFIVANNLAPIMSESFGLCEAFSDNTFDQDLWEQAAAQGMTVMVAAGDNGSAGCDPDLDPTASTDGLNVSGTASTPFNVAVGGTDFDDASNPLTFWNNTAATTTAKSYIPEITWNSSCASGATIGNVSGFCATVNQNGLDLVGGSGGPSGVHAKPPWQSTTLAGVPNDTFRDIPDVSLFAAVNTSSNNFYVFCLADSQSQKGQPCSLTGANLNFSGVGGTSVSSPAFAGIMALVNQSLVTAGKLPAGEGQGNVNYVLYPLKAAQDTTFPPATNNKCNSSLGPTGVDPTCTFYDITKGNNSVACDVAQVGATQCHASSAGNATGILVEAPVPPYTANAPGWSTTPGYDLATGLGSVNVTNLINNWTNVTGSFKTDTTAITAPAAGSVTITHGANVAFTVTVTQGSGTTVPTGDVSLIAEPPGFPQFSVGGATLAANGTTDATVTITTNQLPGDNTSGAGTAYPVVAHYGGDGTFAPSDSLPFNVTVNRENSSAVTALFIEDPNTGNPTTAATTPYGSPYLLRIDVLGSAPNDNQICATTTIPCPTGTITLTDASTTPPTPVNDFLNTATGTPTNKATLNVLGMVEDRVLASNGLIGGAHSIVAAYSGDNSYNPSPGTPAAITITPATTATAVQVNGSSTATVATGQSVTLVATVSGFNLLPSSQPPSPVATASNGAGPTGSVTFSACGTAGSCTKAVVPVSFSNSGAAADAFATASLTTTFTTAGPQTITAAFTSGDTNYTSCTTAGTPAGCALTALNLTVNAPGTFSVASTPLTLSSTTGASANSTITVTSSNGFNSPVTVSLPASLPAGISCTAPAAITPPANGSAQGMLSCQVTASSSGLSAAIITATPMYDAKATPLATPARGANTGKGWLALSAGTGFAALFLFFLPGGRKRLHAALGLGLVCLLSFTLGCNNYNGGGGGGGAVATQTAMTVNADKEPSGTAFTFNVTVTGGTPAGMAQLFDGATAISTAGASAAVSGGKASLTWNPGAAGTGTHAISVHYLGDTYTKPSQSGSLNLTVTGSTTIAITTSPVATPAASPITVMVN